MSTETANRKSLRFLLGFLLVALVLAGGVSYLADSNPDGLDHATLSGCEVVETDGGKQLNGSCIAQNAKEHELASGPLADYTVGGDDTLTGLAGVIGVVVTLIVAGGLFWLLRRRPAPVKD
ncbi:PDGLE domain-containing protein [Actinokineospora sp.]|uniref:PDGLE domain-containing protein n=1 Tax=Actinokineospora sp. TaxID=1872133 RepID=UPI004037710C